jgi:hypothetical protein
MGYDFYSYQMVRDTGEGIDEWRAYVARAGGSNHCEKLAGIHADTLNSLLAENDIPSRYHWNVYLVRKFNMSSINAGLPVLIGSYNTPTGDRVNVNNL